MRSYRFPLCVFLALISSAAFAGNLRVNLGPQQAAKAGARWRVDGGTWQTSGTTVTNLSNAAHTVEYNTVTGWFAPSPVTVTLTNGVTTTITGTYAAPSSLKITLSPSNGQWRVDGGAWRNSGTTATGLAPGAHTVNYNSLANKVAPPTETVTLVAGQTMSLSRSYQAEAALIVNLMPAVGQWRIDGGTWQNSGARVGQLSGGYHAVEYSAPAGYAPPPPEEVYLFSAETSTMDRTYTIASSVTISVVSSQGQWRLNGGPWQASGTTVGSLRPGFYTVQVASLPGWFEVPQFGFDLAEGENKTQSVTQIRHASITVTLAPGTGQWRLNGGPWQTSGTTLGAILGGTRTIDYSAVAGFSTPPSETFYLVDGENKSLTRSYGGASSLTVNVAPAAGQWRVDGGTWQSPGSIAFNLSLGAHNIEYAPLQGYIAPVAETVWFRQNQSLNLTRSYLPSTNAYLEVKSLPAYLSEIGVAKWRVDGGNWNAAGAPVAVTPGTHTLEFQPVSGIEVPPPSSITVTAGAVETVEATFFLTHRLRFFLHSNLVAGLSTQELESRLSQYAAHLQTIWHRESLRRLTFNPATDISIVTASPFSNWATPPVPEYGFELWAYADWSNGSIFGSHGGNFAIDFSGAGGANNMHWTQIYDPSAVAPGSEEMHQFWKQINTITHEFEHTFGAGLGEYYSAGDFDDFTGVLPLYSVDYWTPADPFWNAHTDFWADPLTNGILNNHRLGNPETLPALLDAVHFSGTTRGIIDGCYRNDDAPRTGLPDLTRIRVSVVDASNGQPIPNATLRIWNRPNPGSTGAAEERPVMATSTPGVFEFDWTNGSSGSPLSNYENAKLLKAFANGYQPRAQWEWIYDAQRLKTVDNADVWEITVALDPAP